MTEARETPEEKRLLDALMSGQAMDPMACLIALAQIRNDRRAATPQSDTQEIPR